LNARGLMTHFRVDFRVTTHLVRPR